MPTYFHGWRRKAGCITLLMALALTAAWATSYFFDGEIRLIDGSLESNSGTIVFVYNFPATDYMEQMLYWRIDYWYLVIPLTLLSACLLLSKTKPKTFDTP